MVWPFVTALLAAAATALVAVPLFGWLARRWGLVDKPDNNRKLHATAIPLVGGLVTFATTTLVSIGVMWGFGIQFEGRDFRELPFLLVAASLILLVGVLDDRFNIRGRQKLAGQFLAVTVLIAGGYQFDKVSFGSFELYFGVFSVLVVYVWCLAAINSMNLLDGADGFASTIGIIVCSSLAVMALWDPQDRKAPDAVIMLAMVGSLLGFLRYNFPPAKAYLGDAGSMLIGFLIAAISIRCAFKQAVAYAVFAPVALLAIPFIDTTAAIIRRRFTGRSIYAEDRGHLHHVMARSGLSPVTSLIWLAALCTMTAMGAALAMITGQTEYAIASIVMVLVVMISGRIFAVAEFNLIARRVNGMLRSLLLIRNREAGSSIQQDTIQLQGHHDWQEMWTRLREFAHESELNQIVFDVNAPWMHEGFHAEWKKSGLKGGLSNEWRVELPMIVDGRVLARVVVHAPRNGRFSHHDVVTNLMKITADLEQALSEGSAASAAEASVSRPAGESGAGRPVGR